MMHLEQWYALIRSFKKVVNNRTNYSLASVFLFVGRTTKDSLWGWRRVNCWSIHWPQSYLLAAILFCSYICKFVWRATYERLLTTRIKLVHVLFKCIWHCCHTKNKIIFHDIVVMQTSSVVVNKLWSSLIDLGISMLIVLLELNCVGALLMHFESA
jgi:hypothetical protein